MIISAENTKIKTGYPVKNESRSAGFRTLILSEQDFSFASEEDFEDWDQWITEIKDNNLIVLKDITDNDNENEKTIYIKSELDYEYRGRDGKYRYLLRCTYVEEYHNHILSLSGGDFRAFIADLNYNVNAYLDGSDVKGMDVEMLNVETKKLPEGTEPAWTVIKLVLSDPLEMNLTTQMSWNPNRFDLVHVELSDISGEGSYVDFTIKDEVFGIEIDHLYIDDISITDNEGGITVVMLTEKGCGQYRITASGSLTYGTINVDSDDFYGQGTYIISEDTVSFSNYAFESDTKFQVDIKYSGSATLYAGLVLADFTMVDDINGAVSITSVTELSSVEYPGGNGRYEIVTSTTLTTGDISVDDGTVTGDGEYEVAIEVALTNFDRDTEITTNSLNVTIKTLVSDIAVLGLTESDFVITDTNNGTVTVNSLSVDLSGSYELTLDRSATIGTIEVVDAVYYGSESYEFSVLTFENCGGRSITPYADDFLNPTDGLAERLTTVYASYITAEILESDPYFNGRSQKFTRDVYSSFGVGWDVYASYFKTGVNYKLKFKYRTVSLGTGSDRYVYLFLVGNESGASGTQDLINENLEPSTSYYTVYESDTFTINSTMATVRFSIGISKVGGELIVDGIELIEV